MLLTATLVKPSVNPYGADMDRAVTIGTAAALTGVPASQLRSWEERRLLTPLRSQSGYRLYAADDIDRAREIAQILSEGGRLAAMGMSVPPVMPGPPAPPARTQSRDRGLAPGGGRLIRRLAAAMSHEENLDALGALALECALEAADTDIAVILVADFARQIYAPWAVRGLSAAYMQGISDWRLYEGLVGQVFDFREPLLVSDLQEHHILGRGIVRQEGLRAYACVPLLRGQHRLGVIEVFSSTAERFTREHVEALELVASMVAPVVELTQLRRQLEDLKSDRARSFREWAAQVAHTSHHLRAMLIEELETLAHGLDSGDASTAEVVHDLRLASDRLRAHGGAQVNIVPIVREVVERLARSRRLDIRLTVTAWPPTLPSEFTSQIYLTLVSLVEEAARLAQTVVSVGLDMDGDNLVIDIGDDRLRHENSDPAASVVPAVLTAVRALGAHILATPEPVGSRQPGSGAEYLPGLRLVIPRAPSDVRGDRLTQREREVLEELREGRTNREMATSLRISPKTLQNHLTVLYRKLGVVSRAEALSYVNDRSTDAD